VTEPESPVDLMLACPCGLPDVAQELPQVASPTSPTNGPSG
jgi:hypothetical protein